MAKKKSRSSKARSKSKPKASSSRKSSRPRRAASGRSSRRSTPSSGAATAGAASSSAAPCGPFIWHELMTNDVARSKRFYSQMFGWSSQDEEMMPGFFYTIFTQNGQRIGGMMAISPEMGDMEPHWVQYVHVEDVDRVANRCESLGGEICVPAHDIPVGRFAILRDPSGSKIAIFKPKMAAS